MIPVTPAGELFYFTLALLSMAVGCGLVYGITGRWFVVDSVPRVVASIAASVTILVVAGTISVQLILRMS